MATEPVPPGLDWIQLRSDIGSANYDAETSKEKFTRKFLENPLVPLGCLTTAGALSYGLWAFRQGKSRVSQNMMRLRIGAQGFTIAALVVGVIMATNKAAK